MRLADESWVSALKPPPQLNLPKKIAGNLKPTIATNMVDSDSSSKKSKKKKQSESVMPIVGKSLASHGEAGEAAPGIPIFTFSKTSFSAL
jgi:hypothetical protein